MTDFTHNPVLLNESLAALQIQAQGIYIDCTFGRGGHSQAIYKGLDANGQLFAFDQDPEAVHHALQIFSGKENFTISHQSFASLETQAHAWQISQQVDGILLDLGVSSPQLDDASRGFSFQMNGPLDMRMNTTQGQSAAEWLNSAEEESIANVIYQYGEEKNSRRIANTIVTQRQTKPLETTQDLCDAVIKATKRRDKHKHPATRTFQAIRIFINREFDVLQSVLKQSLSVLKPGGRLVAIAFHSLEDRIVKKFIREHSQAKALPRELPISVAEEKMPLKSIGKAIKASAKEIASNPRARSAVMRVAELHA